MEFSMSLFGANDSLFMTFFLLSVEEGNSALIGAEVLARLAG